MTKLCFQAHRTDGNIWAVWHGGEWHLAPRVRSDDVTWATVYKGLTAKQPRAYLQATEPVNLYRAEDGGIVLTPGRA